MKTKRVYILFTPMFWHKIPCKRYLFGYSLLMSDVNGWRSLS